MSFISNALGKMHLGGLNNLSRAVGVDRFGKWYNTNIGNKLILGGKHWDSTKKLGDFVKVGVSAWGAAEGALALAGASGAGAGAGAAGSAGGTGGAGLSEFGVGDLSALGGTSGEMSMAADTAGAAGLTNMAPAAAANTSALGGTSSAPSYMKYARMGNSVLQNHQDTQDATPKPTPIQAPASDASPIQKKTFIGTALTALQNNRPQPMGGADLPTALQ